ncbi:MAG TPA: imidazole glycerol phosphate synthase subunit HisF [Candidatus Thermoplasmatota archaeon]
MVAKRIIACLDVDDGKVVKGVQFQNLQAMGDPVELATRYGQEGADEITFLDISATIEGRKTLIETVERTAKNLFIPLTVGGGVKTVDDARRLLRAGADKVSINTAAVENRNIITAIAREYGAQCVVIAIDAKSNGPDWTVVTHAGRKDTGMNVIEWARTVERLGAGEILLTSIDSDGKRQGYDLKLTRRVADATHIPVVASGGAGSSDDAFKAFTEGHADAALVASLFHTGQETPNSMKAALRAKGIEVRL